MLRGMVCMLRDRMYECECVRKILYATGEEEKRKKNINRSGGCDAPAMRFDLLAVFAHDEA